MAAAGLAGHLLLPYHKLQATLNRHRSREPHGRIYLYKNRRLVYMESRRRVSPLLRPSCHGPLLQAGLGLAMNRLCCRTSRVRAAQYPVALWPRFGRFQVALKVTTPDADVSAVFS